MAKMWSTGDSGGPTDRAVLDALDPLLPRLNLEPTVRYLIPHLTAVGEWLRGGVPPTLAPTAVIWPSLLDSMGAVAFRAVAPGSDEEDRGAAVALLRAWVDAGLADTPPVRWIRLERRLDELPDEPWFTLTQGASRYVLVTVPGQVLIGPGYRVGSVIGVEFSADGFRTPDGFTLAGEGMPGERRWATRERVDAFVAAYEQHGPPLWSPAAVRELADRTGLPPAEATILWAGLPWLDPGQEFGTAQQRRELGITKAEAVKARKRFAIGREQPPEYLATLLDAAVPDDPAGLWSPTAGDPSPVARMADAWLALHPRPEYDLTALVAAAGDDNALADLTILADPAAAAATDLFQVVRAVGGYLPWLYLHLPVGDALRSRLPDVLDRLRDRLREPGTTLAAGYPPYGWRLPLGRPLLWRPVHEVFAAAWQRIVAGDVPVCEAPPTN